MANLLPMIFADLIESGFEVVEAQHAKDFVF
jgi:hypothetical protein